MGCEGYPMARETRGLFGRRTRTSTSYVVEAWDGTVIPIADDCDTAGIDIGARIVAQVIDTDSYPPRVAVTVLREGHRLVGVSPLRAAEGTTVRYMDARWTVVRRTGRTFAQDDAGRPTNVEVEIAPR